MTDTARLTTALADRCRIGRELGHAHDMGRNGKLKAKAGGGPP